VNEWDLTKRRVTPDPGCPTAIHEIEAHMSTQSENEIGKDHTIDGLSPEDWSLRQARRAFIYAILTPTWWILMLILINLLAGIFPSTSPDSTFVFILWGAMALLFTGTVTYTGVQQTRLIRGYEEQRGLWLARGAVIVGAVFTVASLAIIVAIFTSGDASTRPLF
jgi:hypothetical protein